MSKRQKFFNAMRRVDGSFVPFEFSLCPSLRDEFKKRTGQENYAEYYGFITNGTGPEYTGNNDKFLDYHKNLESTWINEWGVGHKKGSIAHFTEMQHPLRNAETISEFMEYPYPDPDRDYNWDGLADRVKSIKEKDLIAVAGMQCTIFEIAWYIRGMENFMIDMVMNPEIAVYHMDRITAIRCEFAQRYAEAGFDVLSLGDDVSTQLDMMMNPDLWREFIKPRLAKVIKTAKDIKPDMLIFYHGDGNLQKIIPDLIEIGVEILNPIQPECMDPAEIKRKYGDKLSFWGTLGTQTTMPFGTPEEVKETCIKIIMEVGKGGGLLLAPTHLLEPEVPWENIEAFVDTVRQFNEKGTF